MRLRHKLSDISAERNLASLSLNNTHLIQLKFTWNSLEICKFVYSIQSNIMFSLLFSPPAGSMHAVGPFIRPYPGPMRTSSTRRLTSITTQIRRLCASRTFRPRTRGSTNVALISINHRPAIGALMWQFWVSKGKGKEAYLLFKRTLVISPNLSISPSTVPPTQLTILDHHGAAVRDQTAGPYLEGDSINLTCLSSGGVPPPRVSWWREHALVDDSFQVLPDGSVRNVLQLKNIQRKDLLTVSRESA